MEDDGSLEFLNIPAEEGNKQFHGKEINQSELANRTFWVLDITITNTKFGKDRMLVRGKMNLDDDKEFKFFANIYLSELDHIIKERFHIKYYFRYADDIVVLSKDKKELHTIREFITDFLEGRKLRLKNNWRIFPVAKNKNDVHGSGIDFIGYVFYLEHTRLRKSIKKNFIRQAIKAGKHKKNYTLVQSAWYGWTKHSNAINLYSTIKNKVYESNIRQQARYLRSCG